MKKKKEKIREKIYDLVIGSTKNHSELYDELINLLKDAGVKLDKEI